MKTKGIQQVFDTCTELHCNNKIREVLVLIDNKEAIRKQEAKERLCPKCKESQSFGNSVLDIELRKLGLI